MWVVAFAVLALLLLAAGWWVHRVEAGRLRAQKHEEIAAIGALKAGQLQQWRQERLNDATRMAGGPLVRKAVAEFLREPGGPLRADLQARLQIERTAGGYADALIFAPDGQLLLAANDAPVPPAPATQQLLAAALASPTAVLSDFFRHADGVVHIEAAAGPATSHARLPRSQNAPDTGRLASSARKVRARLARETTVDHSPVHAPTTPAAGLADRPPASRSHRAAPASCRRAVW